MISVQSALRISCLKGQCHGAPGYEAGEEMGPTARSVIEKYLSNPGL